MLMRRARQCGSVLLALLSVSCFLFISVRAKIYDRCELARELHYAHRIPLQQIATWVCIAQRESLFNTATVGRLNSDGSADHGIFQISDLYWCGHSGKEKKACGLLCKELLDNDIANDVRCIKAIFEEHTRLSGDGFNAWTTYQPFCRNQDFKQVSSCFPRQKPPKDYPQLGPNTIQDTQPTSKKYQSNPFLSNSYGQQSSTVNRNIAPSYQHNPFLRGKQPQASNKQQNAQKPKSQGPSYNSINRNVNAIQPTKGKVYTRCSLAQEFYSKYNFPLQDIATWVCIAEHQSSFDPSAVGRQNGDGSANYGLFQINDRYWCSSDNSPEDKACHVQCNKLMDGDLTDDVRCIRTIHDEHTRLSGDGFNAWPVYQTRCQNQNIEHISQCFDSKVLETINTISLSTSTFDVGTPISKATKGKVYQKCELAQELYRKHQMPLEQIPTWVCIAEHESNFRTSAVGRLNTDGSADHGLFQISDLYWCSHDNYGGKACNIPCDNLLDSDITDDVRCIKIIHDEHTRISGDGFNAWAVYNPHCRNQGMDRIKQCFSERELEPSRTKPIINNLVIPPNAVSTTKGKVYNKCELAQELYHKHQLPMDQIPTWVCIAQHESSYNTGAVGRLNTDGSADHGLFQISDLYWCTHDQHGGKACNIPCDRLLDSDITDDVRCIRMIHDEHTRISGDGFNAWTVYKPHCRNQGIDRIKQCFTEKELQESKAKPIPTTSIGPQTSVSTKKGKIYNKCELAQELYHKHRLPMEQIPTWVCIAQHESSYNTAAVGRLNTDGSADHGLFQISDLYWCSHDQSGGKACNIPCDKLLDSDLTDDIHCIKMIHEEHTRISGDGFNAWTVYKPHCRNQGMDRIKQCFTEKELQESPINTISSNAITPQTSVTTKKGKIYNKCELAQELYHKHRLPMEQIPTWVCIAQHESSYNTAAVGRLNTDGSADHGLFQISDLYWCSHDQYGGKACNIPCHKFLDTDITDDVRCIKMIHDEHTRISGDGFNAWAVYKPHCRNQGMDRIKQCFTEKELKESQTSTVASSTVTPQTSVATKKGKVYNKCELAQELYHKHRLPMEQIPKWVCIAQHESSYNTAAVGRLNIDGSADHGLFQISDLYWCSHDQYGGKACNIPCDKLLDSDITDDVRCVKMIHDEHTRISGDGFNAWTVYKPHCRNVGRDHIKQCFSEKELSNFDSKPSKPVSANALQPTVSSGKSPGRGKIYKKCELAQELYNKHKMPMEQIPTWVCIAQHESSFNTAAVGRLNTDGSADHGLFQISDLYWCTHDKLGGKACNIPCDKLLDSDITDDIQCIKIIHEEHTGLSGDGFNAWAVYKPHCRNRKLDDIRSCFSNNEIELYENNRIDETYKSQEYTQRKQPPSTYAKPVNIQPLLSNQVPNYAKNPFLQNAKVQANVQQVPIKAATTSAPTSNTNNYKTNPFLSGAIKTSAESQTSPVVVKQPEFAQNYKNNPFLSGSIKISATPDKTIQQTAVKPAYNNNPFLSGSITVSSTKETTPAKLSQPSYNQNPFLTSIPSTQVSQQNVVSSLPSKYMDSNTFRTKPTASTSVRPTQQSYTQNPFLTGAREQVSQQSATGSNSAKPSKYLDSNNFRTKPTEAATSVTSSISMITTAKPVTIGYTPKISTTLKPTTTRTTSTTAKPKTTSSVKPTLKPRTTTKSTTRSTFTSTSSRPNTTTRTTTAKPRTTTTTTLKPKTSTVPRPSTTTAKPRTTISTSKPRTTTTSRTITKKPGSSTTLRPITSRPRTTTSLKPATTKSRTTSTAKPITSAKTTPKSTLTTQKSSTIRTASKITTITPKSTTTWTWHNDKYKETPTKKSTTTTRKPSTTTIRSTTTLRTKTTIKSPVTTTTAKTTKTTKSSKSPTPWSWDHAKLKETTTKRTTTTTYTTRKPSTTSWTTTRKPSTTSKPSTAWSWNNSQFKEATTTNRPTTQATTTTKQSSNKAATKPTTSTTSWNWKTTPKVTTTTKRPVQTTTKTTNTWSWDKAKLSNDKTSVNTTTTWNWNNSQFNTTKPTTTTRRTTTTKLPTQAPTKTTTAWSWETYKLKESSTKTTTKALTTKSTTKKPTTVAATYAWQQHKKPSTTATKSPLTTTTKRPTISTTKWNSKENKYVNTTTAVARTSTTKLPATTTYKNTQTTWQHWQNDKQHTNTTVKPKTTTTKLQTTTSKPFTSAKTTVTTKKPSNSLLQNSSNLTKDKEDPFKHPFFERVRQEQEKFKASIKSRPNSKAATIPQDFKESLFHKDYKNITGTASKTIVSYNYTPATADSKRLAATTKRP